MSEPDNTANENDFVSGPLHLTEEQIDKMKPVKLSPWMKDKLSRSPDPELREVASDDPEVALKATRRLARRLFRIRPANGS